MRIVDKAFWISILALLISSNTFAQTWNWASQVATFTTGGYGTNRVRAISVDANENIYTIGDFGDSALVGGIKIKAFGNGADMYVAKYNSAGVASWVKPFGSSGFLDQSIDITTDAAGDVYVLGGFFSNWDFGTLQVPHPGPGVGLAKYNSSGTVQWAKEFPGATAGPGCVAYGNGFIYAAVGRKLIKYELDGDTVWSRSVPTGGSNFVEYRDVVVDIWGCITLTGYFKGSISYDGNVLTSSSINDPDIMIVMYEADGTVEWARKAGAVSTPGQEDIGLGVAATEHGEIYVVGQYYGKAGFESDSVSAGNAIEGMFVAKYSNTGDYQWVKGSSGTTGSLAIANGVKAMPNGDILVGGYYSIGMTFADTTVSIIGADVTIMRLTSSGSRRWMRRSDSFATSLNQYALAINSNGMAAYAGGQFSTDVTFGSNSLTPIFGVNDGYLAKMSINPATDVREISDVPLPLTPSLSQNFPNPFNPTTTIHFQIPKAAQTNIAVYNLLGQKVRELVNQDLAAGTYSTDWDGRDQSGQPVASGVYFYRLNAGEFTESRKMTLLK